MKKAVVILLSLSLAVSAFSQTKQPVGLWEFNDAANLTKATIGQNLSLHGTNYSVTGVNAADKAAKIGLGSYYICNHGIDTPVTNWTLLMDIKFPSANVGKYMSLYQTNMSNANDGDCFIRNSDCALGNADTGYSGKTVSPYNWYRVVVSVDTQSNYKIFVNGELYLNSISFTKTRFELDPSLLLFADNDGEDPDMYVSNVAIWDTNLSDTEVDKLGSAGDSVLPAPEPYSNLILNTSADAGMSYWTIVNGDWNASSDVSLHSPNTGSSFFSAGTAAQGEISQLKDLSSLKSDIDSGGIHAIAKAYIGSLEGVDQGKVIIDYLDASGSVISSVDSGWHTGATGTQWTQIDVVQNNTQVPAGTRLMKYRVLAQNNNAGDCNVFFDDLSWEYHLVIPGNAEPSVPSITGPANGQTGENIVFNVVSTDPDNDKISYQIDWNGTVSDFSSAITQGVTYYAGNVWLAPGTCYVRARAKDEKGVITPWSEPVTIEVEGVLSGNFLSEPYLQNVTKDAITIMWETDAQAQASVDLDLCCGEFGNYTGTCTLVDSGTYICKVRITGLEAEREYYFVAKSGNVKGEKQTFRTAPEFDTPFSFMVWGDSQIEVDSCQSVFSDMGESDADIAVAVGDIVQTDSYSYVKNPFIKYTCNLVARNKPLFVAWGNHDMPADSPVHDYIENPAPNSFSFDYGNAHFTCVDFSQCDDNGRNGDWVSSLPTAWIENDLASDNAQNAAWRFLFIHVPPYCERWLDGSAYLRANLVPLLENYGVDICFSGHTHEYERGYQNNVQYVICGSGSYLDYNEPIVKDWPQIIAGGATDLPPFQGGLAHGYVSVEVENENVYVKMKAYHPDGSYYGILDGVELHHGDFDKDGDVDFEDFAIFGNAWNTSQGDANYNSICNIAQPAAKTVDINDLYMFISNFMEQ